MSHYSVLVIHNEDQSIAELLAPYDENNESSYDDKWDWWVIGGRWSGEICSNGRAGNTAKIKDITNLQEIKTFAVLNGDGWHEVGEMGWFGFSSNTEEEKEAWDKEFFDKFLKNLEPEVVLTVVDCHI